MGFVRGWGGNRPPLLRLERLLDNLLDVVWYLVVAYWQNIMEHLLTFSVNSNNQPIPFLYGETGHATTLGRNTGDGAYIGRVGGRHICPPPHASRARGDNSGFVTRWGIPSPPYLSLVYLPVPVPSLYVFVMVACPYELGGGKVWTFTETIILYFMVPLPMPQQSHPTASI